MIVKLYNILFYTLFLMMSSTLICQEISTLEPKISPEYDFGLERQKLFSDCISLMTDKQLIKAYTNDQLKTLQETCSEIGYGEACDSLWAKMSTMSCGCSWYCGGQVTSVTASSFLKSTKAITYEATNAGDLNYKTAWVENADGYGIGETVSFEFPPLNPRITKIIIANGYVKDKKTWQNNSRVKQLKMFVGGKPYALLNLEDVYADQTFEVEPIGYKHRKEYSYKTTGEFTDKSGKLIPSVQIKFEILSVYEGAKFKDTAISEIYFDGIDVH